MRPPHSGFVQVGLWEAIRLLDEWISPEQIASDKLAAGNGVARPAAVLQAEDSMSMKIRLLFGPIAAILFCSAIIALGSFVTDYDQVRQTVWEIGEVGPPMQFPFTALLCATAVCLLMFALGLRMPRQGRVTLR
jgi:hypothetical protein